MSAKNISNNNHYCVYCHINKINGKRYIGQTIHGNNPNKRWNSGKPYTGKFKEDINKYGWDNFEHVILENNLTKDEAYFYERYYILQFKSYMENYGYNIVIGQGSEGRVFSEETRLKISKNHKGMIGKKHSIYTKQKMSKSQKGNTNVLGKKWINNGIETKYINAEDLEQYINDGWICGRLANGKIGKHTKPTIPWNKGKTLRGVNYEEI